MAKSFRAGWHVVLVRNEVSLVNTLMGKRCGAKFCGILHIHFRAGREVLMLMLRRVGVFGADLMLFHCYTL